MSKKEKDLFAYLYPQLIAAEKRNSVSIENVIFNNPATIIRWSDGTKTVVKCGANDTFDKEKGLAMAIAKRFCGNKGNYNEIFKKWIPDKD